MGKESERVGGEEELRTRYQTTHGALSKRSVIEIRSVKSPKSP